MFEYGQIIEYVDGTYDTNFNAAYSWCQENGATLDESNQPLRKAG